MRVLGKISFQPWGPLPFVGVVFAFCAPNLWAANMLSEAAKARVESASEYCLNRYKELTHHSLSSEANRVYAVVYTDLLVITFVHGRLGSFAPRSADYYSLLGCLTTSHVPPKILFLAETLKEPLIGREADVGKYYREMASEENRPDVTVVEAVFARHDGALVFAGSQRYSEDEHLIRR